MKGAWTGLAPGPGEPTKREREIIERVRREIQEIEFGLMDIKTMTEMLTRYTDTKAFQIIDAAYTLSREERRRRLVAG